MEIEFAALKVNQTWTLVSYTEGMNVVGCKWIFQIKQKADGSVERYKARSVANGFH